MIRAKKLFLIFSVILFLIASIFLLTGKSYQAQGANLSRTQIIEKINQLKLLVANLQKQLNELLAEEKKSNQNQTVALNDNKGSGLSKEIIPDDYYRQISDAWSKSSFTEAEFSEIQKDKNGRPLAMEEALNLAIEKNSNVNLKKTFAAWANIDSKSLENFSKIDKNYQNFQAHKDMVDWYVYHQLVAQELATKDLAGDELKKISDEFYNKAKVQTPKFKLALIPPKEKFYSLIPTANALGMFYDYGGKVVSYADFCTTGIAFVVAGQYGGLGWIYYAVWTANPYMYKMIYPGVWHLGKAMYGPGLCNKGPVNYGIGSFSVMFFGSSLTP